MSTRKKTHPGGKTGGIVFVKTRDLKPTVDFYTGKVGCTIWLDQGGCVILKHGNLLLGFCLADRAETGGVYTFFYSTREEVDHKFLELGSWAEEPPRDNLKYRIYHFYCRDPEGRLVEFQHFNHPLPGF